MVQSFESYVCDERRETSVCLYLSTLEKQFFNLQWRRQLDKATKHE